jgi:hypothetical protein
MAAIVAKETTATMFCDTASYEMDVGGSIGGDAEGRDEMWRDAGIMWLSEADIMVS